MHYYGKAGGFNVLVIDLLGESLETRFETAGRKLPVGVVAQLGKQMITLLESIHEQHYVYRDVKPDNFLFIPGSTNKLCLIDFGMAKEFRDPHTRKHRPFYDKKTLSGTARYMSLNTHMGFEQSRRDDMESLGNVLLYLVRGSLPWQGLKARDSQEKYRLIGEVKRKTSVDDLTRGHPPELLAFMRHVRQLKFDDRPNYDYLRGLLESLAAKTGRRDDDPIDWRQVAESAEPARGLSTGGRAKGEETATGKSRWMCCFG